MDQQYSKAFFHAFIDSIQKVCRDFLDFDQAVEVCGYLSLEIDNSKKERYVLSELIQNAGDVISESCCVKAFRTVRRNTYSPQGKDDNPSQFKPSKTSRQSFRMEKKENARPTFQMQTPRLDYNDGKRNPTDQYRTVKKSLNNPSGSRRSGNLNMNNPIGPYEMLRVPQMHLLEPASSNNASEAVPVQMFSSKANQGGNLIPDVQWKPVMTSFSGSETHTKPGPASSKRKAAADDSFRITSKKSKESKEDFGHSSNLSSSTSDSSSTPHPQNDPSEDLTITIKRETVPYLVIDPNDLDESGGEDESEVSGHIDGGGDNSGIFDNEALNQLLDVHVAEDMNKHTSRKTRGHVKLFQEYLVSQGIHTPMQDIAPVELDKILGTFFWNIRKDSGEDYEPSYLKNMQSSLERHLKHVGYSYCITRDKLFEHSRAKLKEKQSILFKQGKGNLPNKTVFLTESDINLLFRMERLGDQSPDVLLNTMWLMVNIHFGMVVKNVRDHGDLLWGDIELKVDGSGRECLALKKCPFHLVREDSQGPSKRCFVKLYKTYRDRRARYNEESCPFYLCPNPVALGDWYKPSCAGVNRLNNMVRRIVDGTGLPMEKKYTNSSIQMLIRGPLRVVAS